MKLLPLLSAALALGGSDAIRVAGRGGRPFDMLYEPEKRGDPLQDIVTWDETSLFIRGERVMMWSGEFHPFRLANPSLFYDVFQKIKALGLNMVSFYVDWALLEGKSGEFRADGIFDLEIFFDAAQKAGVYLLARPGPYINAEVSGGGFPGWLQRIEGFLRTTAPDYLHATDNYMANIGAIIAKAQITNGGPVILIQPENEYSSSAPGLPFPDGHYMQYVIDQSRNASVVVPMISNDAFPGGDDAPGTGLGAVDIYGHDGYPLGFNCAEPTEWPDNALPTDWHELHLEQSPNTPYSIVEFQGGSFDPFGGWGFEQCSELLNYEFERVFYKNNIASGANILNLYMIYGGTNWGNLGHPGGYTSYDYGAVIKEDRTITREKYSELKLEAQFLKVSPGYIVTAVNNLTTGVYSPNKDLAITPLIGNGTGSFFVVRHANYSSTASASYKLKLPTSAGTVSVPSLGGALSLHGRDSKIHVTDYPVGDAFTLLYSSAEVFTWKKFHDRTVLILYGGPNEMHEVALKGNVHLKQVEGSGVKFGTAYGSTTFQFETSSDRKVVKAPGLEIYLLDRNSAYNYWVPLLPGTSKDGPAYGSSIMNPDAVIVNGGYLVRSASVSGSSLSLQVDFNKTTTLEIIGAPKGCANLVVNGEKLSYKATNLGNWIASPAIKLPSPNIPDLKSLGWHSVDSLPEISTGYDDSAWPAADHTNTTNPIGSPLLTPVSLYGSDYGFNTGTLVFRGHFTARGAESELRLWTYGGEAYASSVWLNGEFLGSFRGFDAASDHNSTYKVPKLKEGKKYVLTILVDNDGLFENGTPGLDEMKDPRGIIDYALTSSSGGATPISSWKITGNLGGEDYVDKFRGPLNEGGLWFERQGLALPSPPLSAFTSTTSPYEGSDSAGVTYYTTTFPLDLPASKYDIPLSFVFDNSTLAGGEYRALLYVNGFQFGKYVSNVGPQTEFPVPEGILNYAGDNWVGLGVWALQAKGAKVPGFSIKAAQPVQTGREGVELVKGPKYSKRAGAY